MGGNVRKNPKLSGTTHNVFGIQVGVSINVLVRQAGAGAAGEIHYGSVGIDWRKEQKFEYLERAVSISGVQWKQIVPDSRHNWLTQGPAEYNEFAPIAIRDERAACIFGIYSNGIKTNRDAWAYNFASDGVTANITRMLRTYAQQRAIWASERRNSKSLDEVLTDDPRLISWSAGLKELVQRNAQIDFTAANIRASLYRPFVSQYVYFDKFLTERRLQFPKIFPTANAEFENRVLCAPAVGGRTPYWCFASKIIPNHYCPS